MLRHATCKSKLLNFRLKRLLVGTDISFFSNDSLTSAASIMCARFIHDLAECAYCLNRVEMGDSYNNKSELTPIVGRLE